MANEEFIESIRLEGEEWRDVVGYEGLYMVSSFGRVVSLSRTVMRSNDLSFTNSCRILKTDLHASHGYYTASLRKKKKPSVKTVHSLVAQAFIPNPNHYRVVDHIDGNPHNNNVSNLRWCTQCENVLNPNTLSRLLVTRPSLGTPVVRLKQGESAVIYQTIGSTRDDGFSPVVVSCCCRKPNRYHSHRGYKWMYLSDYETLVNKSKNSSIPEK